MGVFRAKKARRAVASALSGLAGATLVAGGCGTNEGIVGGVCANGFTDCDGVCVDLADDLANCGSCGRVCGSGACVAGSCGRLTDAARDGARDAARDAARDRSVHDGTTMSDAMANPDDGDGSGFDGSRHRDGAMNDGSITVDGETAGDARERDGTSQDGKTGSGDGGRGDAGAGDGVSGDSGSGDGASCAPPFDTVAQCGRCDVGCATGNVCAPVLDAGADAASFVCAPLCTAPYVDCGGTCVLFDDDPDNCGGCGIVCPSGICAAAMCVGGASGDLVVVGHDFAAATVHSGEKEVLSNAVFLSGAAPTRVLSFEQYANATQVAHVKALLAATGRPIAFTVEDDAANVPGELTTASFDVFLVYDQPNAPSGTLATVGASLSAAIQSFAKSGGDVVVLDGASGVHQMAAFLTQSGVLATSADTAIANNTPLVNVAPGDAVGNGVILTYASVADTVTFTTTQANGGSVTYVIEDSVGLAPVVIHETVN